MKKNKKLGLVILSAAVIGILLFIPLQPETDPLTSSLENNNVINKTVERGFGTITALNLPIMGSPDAPITIFAFNDYQCPGCKFWFQNIQPNITKNFIETGKANMIFVDSELLGNDSLKASEATYCANEQGKYFEYQKLLFDSQQGIDDGWANSERLKAFAFDLELDLEVFGNCLDSKKYEKKVKFNSYEAKQNGILRAPTFVVVNSEGGHHIIRGAVSLPVFEQVIRNLTP